MKKIILIIGIAVIMIIVISGCNKKSFVEETRDFWFEQAETCERRIDVKMLENLNWYCTEYANRTTINPEWLENCCMDINAHIEGGEEAEYELVINEFEKVDLKLSNKQNNTLYSAGNICFEGNEDFDIIGIDGQTVDMKICISTPKIIETNETICVAKRLRNY